MKNFLPLLVTVFLVSCATKPASHDNVSVSASSSFSVADSKTLSSSSGSTASFSLLDQIRVWTPDVDWAPVTRGTFRDELEVSAGYVPANSIEGEVLSAPELGISKYREALGPKLFPSGWQTDLRQDADGVNGTRWGYVQGTGPDARYLIFSEQSSDCTVDYYASPDLCKNHESRVFLINRVPQSEILIR